MVYLAFIFSPFCIASVIVLKNKKEDSSVINQFKVMELDMQGHLMTFNKCRQLHSNCTPAVSEDDLACNNQAGNADTNANADTGVT